MYTQGDPGCNNKPDAGVVSNDRKGKSAHAANPCRTAAAADDDHDDDAWKTQSLSQSISACESNLAGGEEELLQKS
jgi:hypothetical protein